MKSVKDVKVKEKIKCSIFVRNKLSHTHCRLLGTSGLSRMVVPWIVWLFC